VATTSPDNLRTPDPSDPYNLVPDLATLSGDVQTALNKRSITSGTVAQRTTFTSTATAGWLWQDTDGIKMIWRKDGAVWVPAVWRWTGTNSEMTAFTQAPNGFEWYNTTNNREYLREGSAWVPAFQDSGWLDLTNYLNSAYRGVLVGRRVNGLCEIRYQAGNVSIGTGSTALGTLPDEFKPSAPPSSPGIAARGAAYVPGNNAATAMLPSSGVLSAVNETGGSRTYFSTSLTYFGA
jgi:hypothetical protein